MITHVVLFKLKDRSPEAVEKAAAMLRALEGKVPVIRSIEVGVDVLRTQRSYDIALTVKLGSLADLEAYQAHPEHVLVADYISGVRESAVAVDYEDR